MADINFNPLQDALQGFQAGYQFDQIKQQNQLRQLQGQKIQQELQAKQAQQQLAQIAYTQNDRNALGKLYGINPALGEHVEKSLDNKELQDAKGLQYIEQLPIDERENAYKIWRQSTADQNAPDDYNKQYVKFRVSSSTKLKKDYEKLETAQGIKLLDKNSGELIDTGFTPFEKKGTNAERAGGVVGILADRLKAENPKLTFEQALTKAQGITRQGLTYDDAGNIVPQKGLTESKEQIKAAEAKGGAFGKEQGEKTALLKSMESNLPELKKTTKLLSSLGKTATYTVSGNMLNSLRRQAHLPIGNGAINREEYLSTVKNQVFPLLRETFGPQFTKAEGDSLLTTLGDIDKSPEEKDAALDAFIRQKEASIRSLRSETGQSKPSNQGNKFTSSNGISYEVSE